ncbi:MAG: MFS transporter [Polyangiaceae bacterium]
MSSSPPEPRGPAGAPALAAEQLKEVPAPFPGIVWIALLLEFLERFAYYGTAINLSVYLSENCGMNDVQSGELMAWFALVRSWLPVPVGSFADRLLGFKAALVLSFVLYVGAYLCLYLFPSHVGAWFAVLSIGIAGAFLKPVIPATVRRASPPERRAMGFSLFYASVNAGSVFGKTLAKLIRTVASLRATILDAIGACVVALALTVALFKEPKAAPEAKGTTPDKPGEREGPFWDLLRGLANPALSIFLVLIAGYYLCSEQFYQTFPKYIQRVFGDDAPREYISLINPAAIALFQVVMTRLTKGLPSLFSIAAGAVVAALAMLLMGSLSTSLWGACASFFVFAFAEMLIAPRYYEFISSFAPKGREGMYMGVAIVPAGIGGLVGGYLSGALIEKWLPKVGARDPFAIWSTYAVIGLGCALLLFGYAFILRKLRRAPV